MPKHTIAAGAALLVCTTPVWADLSAQDVWADWQQVYGAAGVTLSASSATYNGGTLTLENISAAMDLGGVDSDTNYGTISLVEQDDGTIRIVIPETMQMTTSTSGIGRPSEQVIEMVTSGWDAVIREEGDARVYDISADNVAYTMEDASSGEAASPVPMTMSLQNVASTYSTTESGSAVNLAQAFAADGMSIEASGSGDEAFALSYVLQGIRGEADGAIDQSALAQATAASLAGLIMTGEMTHSGSTVAFTGDTEDGPVSINGTSGTGRIGFDINGDTLGYTLSSLDAQMTIQPPGFPVPVNVSMAEATTGFGLPMGVSDEPKPFSLSVAYRDLAIDDALWGLFDPTGQLPRDPATVVVELSGTALMTADIFGDPDALAAGGPPGELKTMDLTQLRVALAGAELLGSGAVEFPNPGPIPQPVGKVNLSLDGGLGLIDKLVALGFVPAEQAAFAKGMAGVVARPVGEDQLETEIEFTPGGGITANGLPLQ